MESNCKVITSSSIIIHFDAEISAWNNYSIIQFTFGHITITCLILMRQFHDSSNTRTINTWFNIYVDAKFFLFIFVLGWYCWFYEWRYIYNFILYACILVSNIIFPRQASYSRTISCWRWSLGQLCSIESICEWNFIIFIRIYLNIFKYYWNIGSNTQLCHALTPTCLKWSTLFEMTDILFLLHL